MYCCMSSSVIDGPASPSTLWSDNRYFGISRSLLALGRAGPATRLYYGRATSKSTPVREKRDPNHKRIPEERGPRLGWIIPAVSKFWIGGVKLAWVMRFDRQRNPRLGELLETLTCLFSVDPRGIEPRTSSMPWKRSTN